MAHTQKPDFVFRRNGRVHLNRRGRQFSRLLATEVCASAVVMLDTPCPEVVWRVLATHCIRHFPLHFPSRASPCAITFQLDSTLRVYGMYLLQPASKGPTTEAFFTHAELRSHLHILTRLRPDHILIPWPNWIQDTSSYPDPNNSRPRPHILTQFSPEHIFNSWPK